MSARTIRISFTRNEVSALLDALESLFDEFSPNEAHLIELESELWQRLWAILTKRDARDGAAT